MGDPRPYKESMDGASDDSESERETSGNGPEVKVRLDIAAAAAEPLKVYLRLRPRALGRAFASPCFEAVDSTTLVSTVTVQDNQQQRKFTFTKVFPELSQQEDIFEEVVGGPLASFMAGHHVLLFAYGPTGSGKTYTMQGTPEQPGLIPRTLDRLFRLVGPQLTSRASFAPLYFGEIQRLEYRDERHILQKRDDLLLQQRAKDAAEYSTFLFTSSSTTSSCDASAFKPGSTDVSVWVSCYEIYNENVYDLLVPLGRGQRRTLKLGEDHDHRAYVKNLTEVPVQTAEDAYALLCVARRNLSIAETRLNQSSSRSHCMFNIRLVRCDDASEEPAVSCLTLCDLAGSENPGKTGNVGSRLREAGRINNSLLVLGRCLEALRLGKEAEQRAPFRDSKLTQVMQAFFVGGGIVSLIVNVSPSLAVLEESLGALKFSAVATEVVPVAAEPRHTKCRAAVQRLSKVRRHTDRWSTDCDASERSFDEDNVAELFETVETLQRELDRAQQTIAHLRQRVQAQEESIDRLEDSRRRMVKVYEEVIKVKVDCAKVYMRIELDRKYKAQRKELVKARKEIARLRGETGPPRLSDVIVLGDSEDDSDESDGESADESTSSLKTTSQDYPRQNAPSCSEAAAPAEVRRSLRSTLQAEVDDLRAQLEALSAEKTLLLGAVAAERDAALDSRAQLNSLMQELADTRAERNQAERDADRALEQLRGLREEHREAVVSVELLRNQLAAVSQAQETATQELASLTSQYQQQMDINADLKNRLADMADIVQNTDALRHQVEVLQLQLHEATERQELAESGRLEAESKLCSSKLEHRRELDLLGQQHEATQRTTTSQFQSKVDDLKAKCAKFQQKWAEAEASREKVCSDAAHNEEALLQQLEEVQATLTLKESELECCKELLKNSEAAHLVLLERTGSQKPKLEDVAEEVDENDEGNARRKTPGSKRQRPRRQTQQVGDTVASCDDDDFAAPRRVTRSRAKKSSISVAEQSDPRRPKSRQPLLERTSAGYGGHWRLVYKTGDCSSDGFLHDAFIENETACKAEADDAEWCEEEAGEAGPPLRCPLCPFETRVRESLSRHRRLHARRPLSCPHCDAHYLDQTSLARHLLGHQGGKGALLACPECGTHFTRRDTLEQHMGMHAQRDKPFKCSLCTESFLTYKEMQAHKASHGRKPPHVCEVCGRGYLQLSTLAEHRFSHEEERRFQCGLCDKRFFSSLALKRHNRVHTGERPFRCLTCGLSFAIRAHLLSHKRTHTGERPFSCPSQTCPQAFSTSSAAKRHFLNIHSKNVGGNQGGGPEEEAAEESSRPEGPETENVPFVCEQCGASFRTRAGLSGHVRAHVTSRPYSCPACPRAFTSSGAAARHHRRVHGAPEADVEPATLHRRSEDSEG